MLRAVLTGAMQSNQLANIGTKEAGLPRLEYCSDFL